MKACVFFCELKFRRPWFKTCILTARECGTIYTPLLDPFIHCHHFLRVTDMASAEREQSDARLKVIMQFVKNSDSAGRAVSGTRMSITEIIDAVTQKVKEDPTLATTLTDAIDSACSQGHVRPAPHASSQAGRNFM